MTTTSTRTTLVELLEALHRPGEHVSISYRDSSGAFRSMIVTAGTACYLAVAEHMTGDVWHGVNPVRPAAVGRGTAADVTRLTALWVDLDVKPDAMPDTEAAEAVIADLATMLGTPPAFVVHTGHGMHPYWCLEDDEHLELHDEERRRAAAGLLARWKRLVGRAAAAHGGTVDPVFDLPRVLRTPGTRNRKDGADLPVEVESRGGYVLDVAAITATLDAYGIDEWPDDGDQLRDVVLTRSSWPASQRTCGYVRTMIASWPADTPTRGRHYWAFGQLVRLACARRAGCLTDTDFNAACQVLQDRLDKLRAHDGRRPREVATDVKDALDRAERKTDVEVRAELGNHDHHPDGDELRGLIATTAPSAAPEPNPEPYTLLVADEVRKLRLRDDARTAYEVEKAARQPATPFDHGLLAELLGRPAEPPHRVEGLIPTDAATLVVAQRKVGKTTFTLNLARALLTGGDFLERFPVRPITGRVSLLNFEVSGAQLARWADAAGVDPDRMHLVNLRGRRNPLTNATDRAALARILRDLDVETLIVDPFGRAYTGQSQNDPGEVGAWLVDLDLFARTEVGAHDLILTTHAGWDGERTRGSSALEDWADSIITLTRGRDDDEDGRYLRAIGRDVDVDEDGLLYDPATRGLRMAGSGSRKAKVTRDRVAFLVSAVHGVITASPGMNGTQVEDVLRRQKVQFQKGQERTALAAAVQQGLLRIEQRGAAKHYYPLPPQTSPGLPAGSMGNLPAPPFRGGGEVPGETGTSPSRPTGEVTAP